MNRAKQACRFGIVAALAITLAAAFTQADDKSNKRGVRHQVTIQSFKFTPPLLVVSPGDTIVWTNLDIVPHTVTAQDSSWDSQTLQANDVWELQVRKETSENYLCRFHPMMVGQVQVNQN